MLILTRRSGQRLMIQPMTSLDPATPVGELFRHGPIEILVSRIDCQQVRIGIHAHPALLVAREELQTEPVHAARRKRRWDDN